MDEQNSKVFLWQETKLSITNTDIILSDLVTFNRGSEENHYSSESKGASWSSGIWVGCVLSALWVICSRQVPLGGGPRAYPGHAREITYLGKFGNTSLFWRSWRKWLGRGRCGVLCLDCCSHDLAEAEENGWMNEYYSKHLDYGACHCYYFCKQNNLAMDWREAGPYCSIMVDDIMTYRCDTTQLRWPQRGQ